MRNIDLDQFWPQFAPVPSRPAGARAHDGATVPPGSADSGAPATTLPLNVAEGASHAPAQGVAKDSADQPAPAAPPATARADAARLRLALERAVETNRLKPAPRAPFDPPPATPRDAVQGTGVMAVATGQGQAHAGPQDDTVRRGDAGVPLTTRQRRFDRTPFVWGGLGFVAGIFAWHALGFWSFVSDVVLNNGGGRRDAASPMPQLADAAEKSFGKFTGKPATAVAAPALSTSSAGKPAEARVATRCVEIAIDRANGGIARQECTPSDRDVLRDAGYNRRGDKLALRPRLQDPVAWSGATAVEADATDTVPEANAAVMDFGTLKPSDLKLDLETRN